MTRFAVTAASGQLGSEIVKATIEAVGEHRVIGLARTPGKAESLGIEVRPGDYNSPSDWEESLRGIDTLLVVSGMDAPEKRIDQHRNVIAGIYEGIRNGAANNDSHFAIAAGRDHQSWRGYFDGLKTDAS